MIDVDLRELRYFVTVAECSGFRRTAQVLNVAQPALTRQTRSFELELNVEPFNRSNEGISLTPAGGQLLLEARCLPDSATALQKRISGLHNEEPRLRIGFAPGVALAVVIRESNAMYPAVEAELVGAADEVLVAMAADGVLDVCFGRLAVASNSASLVPLSDEPRVAARSSDDPMARVSYIGLEDLFPYRLLQDETTVPEVVSLRPTMNNPKSHCDLGSLTTIESLEYVAARRRIFVLPVSVACLVLRSDVIYREVDGLGPIGIAMGHPENRLSTHASYFIKMDQSLVGDAPGGGGWMPTWHHELLHHGESLALNLGARPRAFELEPTTT